MNIHMIEGKVIAPEGMKVGIIASRFNSFIVEKLLEGAVDGLVRHGVEEQNIDACWVPGAFEIPFMVSKLMDIGKYDAIISLGCVIQGSTAHADYINGQVSKALGQLAIEKGTPAIYGVVTTENIEQAIERSGTKAGNRGADAAHTAIEMANLVKTIPQKA